MNANAPCYWFTIPVRFLRRRGRRKEASVSVYDSAQQPRGLNQAVLSDEFLPYFISIMNVLKGTGLAVRAIELDVLSLQEVDVLTMNGPTIYFSLQFSADEYLAGHPKTDAAADVRQVALYRLPDAKPALL